MKYLVSHGDPKKRFSTVITSNEVVVWATPAMQWLVGQPLERMLSNCRLLQTGWKLVSAEHVPPTNRSNAQ